MKLLATADIHIRGGENAAGDLAVLERILQAAEERGCDAVLIGGDLLDTPFIEKEHEAHILGLLARAGCRIFLAAGNHDPLSVTPLYEKLPANVYCFPPTVTKVTLAEGISLYGYSADRKFNETHPLRGFSVSGEGIHLLLGHGEVEGGRTAFQPIAPEELINSGLQLAVIGHIHKGEQRNLGGCRLLVPGIPEGHGMDELGEKYVYVLDVANAGIQVEPCRVALRTYMEYPMDLTDCSDANEMLTRMEQVEIPADVVARLILTGSVSESPAAAMALYSERTGREVKDLTDSFGSPELLREQNTLQGAFVRRALAEIEAAPPEEQPRLRRALELGLRALKEARE